MSYDLNKIRRYELKYTITESIAAEIQDYIKGICSLDKHVPAGEDGYTVNNLYFDTPDLQFYYDTKHRKLTRYKPRARYYGREEPKHVWPELKYRQASVIWKKRKMISVDDWPTLFSPQLSKKTESIIKERLDGFEEVIHWHNAQPILHVRYFRQPFVTELEEYGRVTFDRQLSYCRANGSINLSQADCNMLFYDDPVSTNHYESPVLLEIKVETLVPYWAIDIIRKFNLIQRPFSKYCYGIDNIMGYFDFNRNSVYYM